MKAIQQRVAPVARRLTVAGRKAAQARARLRSVLRQTPPRDERETRERWLAPMVAGLGYRHRELAASDAGAPAWLLQAASGEPIVFLGRRVGRALDRLGSKGRDLYQATNPEFALWRALEGHGSAWGLLSDGLRWRLYHRSSGLHRWMEVSLGRDSEPDVLTKLFGSRSLAGGSGGETLVGRLRFFRRRWERRGSVRLRGSMSLPWEGAGADLGFGALPWASLEPISAALSAGGARAVGAPHGAARACWMGMGGLRLALVLGSWIAHRLIREDPEVDRVAAEMLSGAQRREFDGWLRAIYERLFVGLPGKGRRGVEQWGRRQPWVELLERQSRPGDPFLGSDVAELLAAVAAHQQRGSELFGRERELELEGLKRELSLWALLGSSSQRERSEQRLRRALERTRDLLDLWVAHRRFRNPTWSELRWLLLALHGSDAGWRDLLTLPALSRPLQRIRRSEPLHWELEFPQVFHPAAGAAGFRAILAEAGPRCDLAPPYGRGLDALLLRLQPLGWLWIEAAPRSAAAVWRAARRVAQRRGGICRRPAHRWVLLQRAG